VVLAAEVCNTPTMELNIADAFEAIEQVVGDRECIVSGGRSFTWARTGERMHRFAAVLLDAGLGRVVDRSGLAGWESGQDHVALYLHNGNEYLEAMFGSYVVRCAPVNVNYRYRAAELAYVLSDSRSRVIVYHGAFGDTLAEVAGSLPELSLLLRVEDGSGVEPVPGSVDYEDALGTADPAAARGIVRSPDDLYLCYTGGTTGRPKGVLWRQADFLVSALGVRRRDGSDHESLDELAGAARSSSLRALPAPPLMHGAAHWNAISAWLAGGTVIIQSETARLDPADIWRTVQDQRATSLLIVGDPFARPLLDEWDRAAAAGSPYDASSLRHILSGGAILSPGTKQQVLDRLPHLTVVDVLGSSESGRQGVSQTASGDDTTTPFAPSATSVVLAEDRSERLDAGDHRIGWLAQTGRVPLGYLDDESKTSATFPVIDSVRYAVAGDRARLDDHGNIVLLGRDSVTINTGGEKVFAEEVETALKAHPAVFDAVVCGRPSQRWGQEVVGIVALRPGFEATDEDLVAHCGTELAGFKLPKAIIRLPHVERSPSGKADYSWATGIAAR